MIEIPQSLLDLHLKFLNNHGISYAKQLKSKMSSEDREWMDQHHLNPAKLKWLILNEADEIPKCPTCGKEIAFEKGRTYCSNKCRSADPNVIKKIENTNLERYGTKSAIQNDTIKNQIKQTNLERYGSEWPFGSEEVREKIQNTWMEKYGTDHPMHTDEIRQRRIQSCMDSLGVPTPLHSKEVWEKIKATNLERRGVEYIINDPEFRERMERRCEEKYGSKCSLMNEEVAAKVKETMMKKYGVEHGLQSSELREKSRQTMIERYGADNPAKRNSSLHDMVVAARQEAIKKRNYVVNKSSLAKISIEIATPEAEYPYVDNVQYRCLRCGNEFESHWRNSQVVRCPQCAKRKSSRKEKDVCDWIKSIYSGQVIENDRKQIAPYELDIYLPDAHLAIEFNGTYWHSANIKPKNYHLNKTLACNAKGIRLIHVFEWEWDRNEPLIKALIKGALGLHAQTIYARQCEAREMSQSDYKAFLSLHHLQGPVNSSLRLGLFFQNEPVMVAGWGRSRFNSKDMELHRLCAKEGANVIGGFSKLIAHSGLEHFISYVDRSHFTGDGYRTVGFKEIGSTLPGYRWVNEEGAMISRQMAQKSRLPKLLGEEYDPELTEVQNMESNGWHQVFDCGNLKMEWIKK